MYDNKINTATATMVFCRDNVQGTWVIKCSSRIDSQNAMIHCVHYYDTERRQIMGVFDASRLEGQAVTNLG